MATASGPATAGFSTGDGGATGTSHPDAQHSRGATALGSTENGGSRMSTTSMGTPASAPDPGSILADAMVKAAILDGDSALAYGALFSRFISQQRRMYLDWHKIAPPPQDRVVDYSSLEACPSHEALQQELLNKVAIVKLNGGLGTSMGCRGPKSAIPVRNNLTFLDLTVRQIEYLNARHGADVPLILMNSFRTHEATVKIMAKYQNHPVTITCFTQSCFPRVDASHYTPIPLAPFSHETQDQWYPPGHGDVYRALDRSGLLDALLSQGREYIFISNVDNLTATVDLNILHHLVTTDIDFAMEVTDKTRGDIQGGTLIQYDGKVKLLEISQVTREHEQDFKSLKTFTCFNTNNLWASLKAIKELIATDAIRSPVLINERLSQGTRALELETAAGAAIEFFKRPLGIRVPRSRFLPVKSTSDLLAVQSNLWEIRHGTLVANPLRDLPTPPVIKLGPEFTSLEEYTARIPYIPDLLYLDHLTISGNCTLGKEIALRGTVILVAKEGERIDLPSGCQLENNVVTGHLRVLEH